MNGEQSSHFPQFSFRKSLKTRAVTSMRQTRLSSAQNKPDQYLFNFLGFFVLFCFASILAEQHYHNVLLVFCFWECLLLPCHCTLFVNICFVCDQLVLITTFCILCHKRPIVLKYLRKKNAWTEDGEQKVSEKMQNSSFRYCFFPLSCHSNAHKAKRCRLLLLTQLVELSINSLFRSRHKLTSHIDSF